MSNVRRWTKHKAGCGSLMRPWRGHCDCGLDELKLGDLDRLGEEIATWPAVEEHDTDAPEYPL